MQKSHSILFLLLLEAVCLKLRLGVDHHVSIVLIQCMFSVHSIICLHPWHICSVIFPPLAPFPCFWQSTWHSEPSFLCHCVTCIYLPLLIFLHSFSAQLICLESCFFVCLSFAHSLSVHWVFCIHSHAQHVS